MQTSRLLGVVAFSAMSALGCTGSSPGVSADASGGGDGSGDGAVSVDAVVSVTNACDDAFDVMTGIACGNASLPQTELDRTRPRWQRACVALLALPGTSTTATSLDACMAALRLDDSCDINVDPPPDACAIQAGTLAGGAACRGDSQCQSLGCVYPAPVNADGGIVYPLCGQCVPPAQLGQACSGPGGQGCNAMGCVPGTGCDPASHTCVAVAPADIGASCASCAQLCKPGLYCAATMPSPTCAQPAGLGMSCQSGACAHDLRCDTTTNTCGALGQQGAACMYNKDCVRGLGCSSAHACTTISWAGAGQPCDGRSVRCLVGSCLTQSADAGAAVCPTVIPDGQPCSSDDPSSTCDAYTECAHGVCTIEYAASCM